MRSAIYIATTVFMITDTEKIEMLNATVVGAMAGDYATWFIRNIMMFPSHIAHGCYDALLNFAFGWFMWRFCEVHPLATPESTLVGFGAFMVVVLIKLACYGFKSI